MGWRRERASAGALVIVLALHAQMTLTTSARFHVHVHSSVAFRTGVVGTKNGYHLVWTATSHALHDPVGSERSSVACCFAGSALEGLTRTQRQNERLDECGRQKKKPSRVRTSAAGEAVRLATASGGYQPPSHRPTYTAHTVEAPPGLHVWPTDLPIAYSGACVCRIG